MVFIAIKRFANNELLNMRIYTATRRARSRGPIRRVSCKLEQADGGTLFMDEIRNMSGAFQDRILRVIE